MEVEEAMVWSAELDDNTYALAVASKTIQFLTDNMCGKKCDTDTIADLARKQEHAAHVVSHESYREAENAVDRHIAQLLEKLEATEWYAKHGTTALHISLIDKSAKVEWLEDSDKDILLVDGVPKKRVSKSNADMYRALRTVYNPAMELCNLATSVPAQQNAFSSANVTEMHWEKNITASAAIDHGQSLAAAIARLNTLI
jgi:hypothetical protein